MCIWLMDTINFEYSLQVVVDTGWGPNLTPPSVTETDEPIIQQMNNVRNYIRQAR